MQINRRNFSANGIYSSKAKGAKASGAENGG